METSKQFKLGKIYCPGSVQPYIHSFIGKTIEKTLHELCVTSRDYLVEHHADILVNRFKEYPNDPIKQLISKIIRELAQQNCLHTFTPE